jgi:hypothetical protein
MNRSMRIFFSTSTLLLAAPFAIAHDSMGVAPSQLPPQANYWGKPGDQGNQGLADARTSKSNAADEAARSAAQQAINAAERSGLDKALGQIKTVADMAKQALDLY